ncbi:MAG TPA: hypothetical protein VFB63_33255 [Bryobacteraceae bacterium]|jgi:hypothetical protein|nr:hypothetical protein [Bryobacteraceae bacterium]
MLASAIIIAVSVGLFVYWFRYSCMLILNTKTVQSYAADVAQSRELNFLRVQQTLTAAETPAFAVLREDLQRDYEKISSLLSSGVGGRNDEEADGYALERAMLGMNFRWLNVQYAVASRYSERIARTALLEMSQIVEHHANAFGEALAAQRC